MPETPETAETVETVETAETVDQAHRRLQPDSTALRGLRICDFSGQLAGAGATRMLAAFGAQVIRIEDPVRRGRWDILRGAPPFRDERRSIDLGGAFNNHNVEKLGIAVDLRQEAGREIVRRLVRISDVVTENFAAGVLARMGFPYDELEALRPGIIYVSNCGFGHTGPFSSFKTWGPIVQACCGLTFTSALADQPPAGWGYSYMDHMGGNFMALAILAALVHRNRTGEGQWIDMSCVEAGATLLGPEALDVSVNGRLSRRPDRPSSNRSTSPAMAPHGIYPCDGADDWLAIVCRDDAEWGRLTTLIGGAAADQRFEHLGGRQQHEDELDRIVGAWTGAQRRDECVARIRALDVPVSIVARPADRIDGDPATTDWGLWPTVHHSSIGDIRVDGLPVHLSDTDWSMRQGGPGLGEDDDLVLGELLGYTAAERAELRDAKVIL